MPQTAQQTFREQWLAKVDDKNTVLCAGLDPAEFDMGRGEKGLPEGVNKLEWALRYIESVAPFCAAIKPNIQYWKEVRDMRNLHEIRELAHSLDLLVIEDSKLADIGSTNDAGVYYAADKSMDAVTFSPFAGNMDEAVGQANARKLGVISMCLMSNPQYKRMKDKLVNISESKETDYRPSDIIEVTIGNYRVPHVKQYIQLAHDAKKFGVAGIVIGAPSPKDHPKPNHIESYEIQKARKYAGDKMLVLLPGVGFQGGEAGEIWKYFGKNDVIVNVGRSLMLPNGSNSTPKQQAETAKNYKSMLNELRAKK